MHAAAPVHTRTFTCTRMSVYTHNVRAYVRAVRAHTTTHICKHARGSSMVRRLQTFALFSAYANPVSLESFEASAESAAGPTLNLN